MKRWLLVLALVGCGGGHPPVRVEPTPEPVAPAPAPEADLSLPVRDIVVLGLPAARAEAARKLVQTQVGAVADPGQLRRDARAIWDLGEIADVEVRADPATGGVVITFAVTARPLLGMIDIRGATEREPREQLELETGQVFDPRRVNDARDRMLVAYEELGFVFADAAWTAAPGRDDTVDLRFDITEGNPVTIASIGFRGNQALASADLTAILKQRAGLGAGDRYARALLHDALVFVAAAYYDRGYVDVEAPAPEEVFSADLKTVDLTIPIVEGAQYRVGKLSVSGALIVAEKRYLKALGVKRGEVFNRAKITAGITAMLKLHAGHPAPIIEPQTKIDTTRHVVDLELVVTVP